MAAAKTTIRDIARHLNITASTVSRALNGHAAISDATRKAVSHTAKRLNYRHNKIASSLRLGKTKIIGVIIPSAEINFFGWPLSFYMAAQGSLIIYVILIYVYAKTMRKLDLEFNVEEGDE